VRRLGVGAVLGALVAGASVAGGSPSAPGFRGSVEPIPASLRAHMTSWHSGCPTPVGDLRLVTLTHWGFDRRVHTGRLILAASEAPAVLRAMRVVFAAHFPIRRMQSVEAYGADDDRSMAADNTSAFNCRRVEHSTSWSAHAYGVAIDVNPLENPYVHRGLVSPPRGKAFLDRSRWQIGMIHAGDPVVRAFAAIGWSWGGSWRSPKDYQHFSATGN
jgi:D-alanyl-D-alanine carboxypeptidase-like protein